MVMAAAVLPVVVVLAPHLGEKEDETGAGRQAESKVVVECRTSSLGG